MDGNVTHAIVHAKPLIHTVVTGVSYMTALITSSIVGVLCFALGYYVKGRGFAGIKIDVDNIKKDIENLKVSVSEKATPVVA